MKRSRNKLVDKNRVNTFRQREKNIIANKVEKKYMHERGEKAKKSGKDL